MTMKKIGKMKKEENIFVFCLFFYFRIPRKMIMTMMMILMVLCGKQATVMMTGSGSEKKLIQI